MGYGIPATEFLGICILMADFDLEMDTLQVVDRLEAFQREEHRRFGTSNGDFKGSLLQLLSHSDHSHDELADDFEHILRGECLGSLADHILEFDHVWCNDEGEDWQELRKEEWPEERRDLPYWADDEGECQPNPRLFTRVFYLDDKSLMTPSLRFDHGLRKLFQRGAPSRRALVDFFDADSYRRVIPFVWTMPERS